MKRCAYWVSIFELALCVFFLSFGEFENAAICVLGAASLSGIWLDSRKGML